MNPAEVRKIEKWISETLPVLAKLQRRTLIKSLRLGISYLFVLLKKTEIQESLILKLSKKQEGEIWK